MDIFFGLSYLNYTLCFELKAIAGEAGVPFFYRAGSEFEEMWVILFLLPLLWQKQSSFTSHVVSCQAKFVNSPRQLLKGFCADYGNIGMDDILRLTLDEAYYKNFASG